MSTNGEVFPLFESFPLLSAIPRIPLAHLPTRIEILPNCSSDLGTGVFVKRDDLSHDIYGGNKCRKYEFILGRILQSGKRCVYSAGVAGSNHLVAFSYFGRLHGLDPHFYVLRAPMNRTIRENLLLCRKFDADLIPKKNPVSLVMSLTARYVGERKRTWIQVGASTPEGVLGYVNAGIELVQQMRDRGEWFDRIFVPVGTMGTLLGIFLGLELERVRMKREEEVAGEESTLSSDFKFPIIHGIVVMPPIFNSDRKMGKLCCQVVRLMQQHDPSIPNLHERLFQRVRLERRFIGKSYAWPTVEGRVAAELARRDGFEFDDVYLGKVFAGLIHYVKERQMLERENVVSEGKNIEDERILLWLTKNGQSTESLLQDVDWEGLPTAFHKYFDGSTQEVTPTRVFSTADEGS